MKNIARMLIALSFLCFSISAQAAPEFFHGKTLTIIVTTKPGGGHDMWARDIAPYMKKYLDVSKVKVVNKPGGGNLIGDNAIYASKPDGLTIGVIDNIGAVFAQMFNKPGVHYKIRKFVHLGTVNYEPLLFAVQPDGKYQSFEDLENSHTEIKALVTGSGGVSYDMTQFVLNAFGIHHKAVAGFGGMHQLIAAFLSGDGDVFGGTSLNHILRLGDKVKPILVVTKDPIKALPNVPTVMQEINKADLKGSSREALVALTKFVFSDVGIVAPPGIPSDRVEALETALKKTIADPSLRKKMRKEKEMPHFTSGQSRLEATNKIFKYEKEFKRLNSGA